jgi:hypothetical protein
MNKTTGSEDRNDGSQLNRFIGLWLFFFILIPTIYFYPGGGHNEAARLDTIRAVLTEHRFSVDTFAYNSADLISVGGHYYSSKAPGTFVLGLIPYFLFDRILGLFPFSVTTHDHLICYLTSATTVGLLSALCGPVIFLLLVRLKFARTEAILTALIVGLGTIQFPIATAFLSHSATAAFVLFAFYFLYHDFHSERSSPSYGFGGGFCTGFAILLEYPAAIAGLYLGLYCLYYSWRKHEWRTLFFAGLGFMTAMVVMMTYDQLSFGNPFFIPYESYASGSEKTFEAHKHGLMGVRNPLFDWSYWPQYWQNLLEITVRPLRGIFYNDPVLIMALPGFLLLLRKRYREFRTESIFAFVLAISFFIFNAGYGDSIVYWGGGASFGPRHLIPCLPLLALPLAATLSMRGLKPFTVALMSISILICLIVAAVEPRAPYEPKQILELYYWPHFYQGQLAITEGGIFSKIPVVGNYVAFNWGGLLGLTTNPQLLPLLLFFIGMAIWLRFKYRMRFFLSATIVLAFVLFAAANF